MLKIKQFEVEEKFSEIHFRHRMYQDKSIMTINIMTEFFPALLDDSIVSEAIDIKLDVDDIHSLQDLEGKSYKGKVGFVTLSVNNHGTWEHKSLEEFSCTFGHIDQNKIEVTFECEEAFISSKITMVSLYTTSTSKNKLNEVFDMSSFYEEPIIKEINKRQISKYFIKK